MTVPMISTVPGAINAAYGYMQTMQTELTGLSLGAYIAPPVKSIANNYISFGQESQGWSPVSEESYEWMYLNATGRSESYSLLGTIRAWSSDSSPLQRYTDAYAILNAFHTLVYNDPRGGGNLSASGSWGNLMVRMSWNGPLNVGGSPAGWGVVLEWELAVINTVLS